MQGWTRHTVDELIEKGIIEKPLDGNHGELHPKGADFVTSGIPFIMASDINNGQIDFTKCSFITKKQADKLRKGFARAGDVLLTHKASIGRTAVVPKIEEEYLMLTPQVTYYRIKDKSLLSNHYLKYFFNSSSFQNEINTRAGAGSTRAYIGITDQRMLTIQYPPFQEQSAIASILSTLDDKIELNLQMNKTLEEMAIALYKHWFVDFGPFQHEKFVESELGMIPEGWEVKKFGETVLKYIDNRGKTPPIVPDGIPLLEVKHISSNLFPKLEVQKYVDQETYDSWFRLHLEANDIIISTVGTIGLTALVPKKSRVCIAQNLLGIRFINKRLPRSFMFYLMKSPYFLNEIENRLVITVQKSIKRKDLNTISVLIPSFEHIMNYSTQVDCYLNQIENNIEENQTLTTLRDTLLPKLISGQIRVKDAEQMVAAAL